MLSVNLLHSPVASQQQDHTYIYTHTHSYLIPCVYIYIYIEYIHRMLLSVNTSTTLIQSRPVDEVLRAQLYCVQLHICMFTLQDTFHNKYCVVWFCSSILPLRLTVIALYLITLQLFSRTMQRTLHPKECGSGQPDVETASLPAFVSFSQNCFFPGKGSDQNSNLRTIYLQEQREMSVT